MNTDVVELEAVEALSDTVDGLLCRVGERRLLIPARYRAGSEIRKPGDRGRLVLPRWLAIRLGLFGVVVPVTRPARGPSSAAP